MTTPAPGPGRPFSTAETEAIWQRLDRPDLNTLPDPLDWQVCDILAVGALTFVFGKSEVGKSFVTVGLSASVATGEPFAMARATKPGRVLYVATEGEYGIKRRLWAWAWATSGGDSRRYSELRDRLRDSFAFASLEGRSLSVNLADPTSDTNRLLDAIGADLDLVIVDTLNGATPGVDENHSSVAQAFNAVKARGPFGLVIVHHEGHGDEGRMRGSSALIGQADGIIRATRHDAVPLLPEGHYIVRLDDSGSGSRGKRKDSEPVGPLAFVIGDPPGLVEHYASRGLAEPGSYASAAVLRPWVTTETHLDATPEVRRVVDAMSGLGEVVESAALAEALGAGTKNLTRTIRPAIDAGVLIQESGGRGKPNHYRLTRPPSTPLNPPHEPLEPVVEPSSTPLNLLTPPRGSG